MSEEQNRFSLRKLSVGLASVLIGVSIFGASQTVKADTVANNQTSSVTSNAQSSDTQKNENAVKSTFSNDNQVDNAKNNLIQTQVEGKKDQKQDSVPKTQEVNDSSNLDAEKSTVGSSSIQQTNNQSNDHAEDNSQSQNEQKLDLTKNSQLAKKVLATNLTQDSNDDWGTDPSKYGFHKTNAGWTKLQQGKDYTSVAKDSHTILLNSYTSKELSHNNSFEVADRPDFGTDITATIDKNDIKQGNRILISSTAELYKDRRHFINDTSSNIGKINVISNGVKIGHIEANARDNWSTNTNSAYISYFLVVDQTQNMIKDLDLHIHLAHTSAIDWWGNHWMFLKGTTPDNPAQIKLITNDDTTYNYTVYADSTRQAKPQHIYDSVSSTLSQDLSYGNLWFDGITRNPDGSSIPTDYTLNKVFKFSRPKSVNGVTIPNFKSTDFVPAVNVESYFPVLSKDGVLGSLKTHEFNINGVRLTDGLSVQQVTEAAKRDHVVYSISNDGQSMLVGINFATNRDNLAKLTGSNYSADDAVNDIKGKIGNTRALAIDYPNEANDITTRSVNWAKNHNGEPYQLIFTLHNWPSNTNQPNIQTITDVTLNTTQHEPTITNSSFPKDNDLHFDASVYKQLNVKFIDDDDNEKVINNDTFNTSTGTDLTYNIKDATDKTFNSTTDIAFPSNYVLNQANSVHFGVIQDTNPDIIIHVKHLVKIISGDADLDLYPDIKKALNSDARRTITITFPAGKQGNNPSSIVQSVHYIRSGKADFTNDTVDESSLTKWNPVASSAHGVTITNGETTFDAIKLPHINGYRTYIIRDKANPAMFMVSFMAVPTENKPSTPVEVAPSKPSAPTDEPNNSAWSDLNHEVVDALNQSDSGWTMPTDSSTYTVEVPADDTIIDLSDLVIAEPVHAQTHTQIRVNKRFKLSKKHSIKHLSHRKKAVKSFKKYRL